MNKMKKKMIAVVLVAVPILGLFGVSGCTNADQINPYVFASGVNSVDSTGFFNNIYGSFLSLGMTQSTDDTDDDTDTSSTATDASLYLTY